MRKRTGSVVAVALLLLAGACNRTTLDEDLRDAADGRDPSPSASAPAASVEITSPASGDRIDGNSVELGVELVGFTLGDRDDEASGHLHVFVDEDPVETGQPIPTKEGIEHSSLNPVLVTGLEKGEHRLVVVLGDRNHVRIGDAMDEVTVQIAGPSLEVTGPAKITQGSSLTINVSVDGFTIVATPQGEAPRSGHLHAIVDKLPEFGKAIPAEEGIIHSVDRRIVIEGLTRGTHTIYVVAGDGGHVPFRPLVADKLIVTVT